MGYWKKHQKKDLEALLHVYHEAGWRIENPPLYYTVKCPCGAHQRHIALTPSGANYVRNTRAWLYRQSCMKALQEEASSEPLN